MTQFEQVHPGVVIAGGDVRLEAAARHVRLWPVDLAQVTHKAGLMATLAADLELPDWFGANFDALYDLLTDVDLVPDRAGLLLVGLDALTARDPDLGGQLLGVLLEAQTAAAEFGRQLWLFEEPAQTDRR